MGDAAKLAEEEPAVDKVNLKGNADVDDKNHKMVTAPLSLSSGDFEHFKEGLLIANQAQ